MLIPPFLPAGCLFTASGRACLDAHFGSIALHSHADPCNFLGSFVSDRCTPEAVAFPTHLPASYTPSHRHRKEATLFNANALILGAGGITLSLLTMLAPFTPTVTVLRRKPEPIEDRFVPEALKDKLQVGTLADLDKHIPEADVVIVNCALTSETKGCLGKRQFGKMKKSAIVVNVARGEVVKTDDLVEALRSGTIFGAGLDVTHPEPLPDGHPLWSLGTSNPEFDFPAEKGGKRANLIIVSRGRACLTTRAHLPSDRPVSNDETLAHICRICLLTCPLSPCL